MTATRWDSVMSWAKGALTKTTRTSARPLEAEVEDRPESEGDVCFSGQVWRKRHEYLIDSPEGTRCCFCLALEAEA